MKSEQRKKEGIELIDTILEKLENNEIDMFQARKRLINLYKKDVLNARLEGFIKSENLEPKPKLELNRWIVYDTDDSWMIYLDGEESRVYGVNYDGDWVFRESNYTSNLSSINTYNEHSEFRYATDEEILERLSKIAVKMGYKERQSECLSFFTDVLISIDFGHSFFNIDESGNLWIINNGDGSGNLILKNGKWAKFIETDEEKKDRKKAEIFEKISELTISSIQIGNGTVKISQADLERKHSEILDMINEL